MKYFLNQRDEKGNPYILVPIGVYAVAENANKSELALKSEKDLCQIGLAKDPFIATK